MMFDVTDTLLESFYAYTNWAIEDDSCDVELVQEPEMMNQEWTEEDEEIARHTTVLLAS
ncbi:hypothetical protein [Ktedonospora formicarum]|uniref:Uncharacterized protein n=1 Tax=Ktedonospora formicarum TaxID=2778364 RepID=A0A8J3I249_9CHLR|nr:hypothetical protein [Ktedonospora formicarum]GHO44658.1 hypothetical protein KSX_28210 [Ktedonospora formicarum]